MNEIPADRVRSCNCTIVIQQSLYRKDRELEVVPYEKEYR